MVRILQRPLILGALAYSSPYGWRARARRHSNEPDRLIRIPGGRRRNFLKIRRTTARLRTRRPRGLGILLSKDLRICSPPRGSASGLPSKESFMAEELNRTTRRRETQAGVRLAQLPAECWQALNRLHSEGTHQLHNKSDKKTAEHLQLEISEMEVVAGVGFSLSNNENIRSLNSLSHFQEGIKGADLLLSFHLRPQESFL
jgi:hypothetical protein